MFFEQGTEWKEQDQLIKTIRQGCTVSKDKHSKTLMDVVKDEVDFQYYLWRGDYPHALESGQKVVDKLSGNDFKAYRGLWYYFVGCIAWQLSRSYPNKGFEKLFEDNLDRAISCIDISSWFSDVALPTGINITKDKFSNMNICSAEQIQENITVFGTTGKTFGTKMDEIKELIYSDIPGKFDNGLTKLGVILGFDANHPSDHAAPDSVWQSTDSVLILFEAKSDETKNDGISVSTCREANGHYDWAKSKISGFDKINKKYVVVVPQRTKIDKLTMPFANNLYFMHISRIRQIFEDISGVYIRIRSQFIIYNEEEIKSKIMEELVHKKLDPESLIKEIENAPLNKLPQI